MDAEYGSRYRELFENHWWWRARERIVLSELDRIRPTRAWGSILDVGCGDGLFFPALASLGEPEGIEPEADIVTDKGRRRGKITVAPFDERFKPGKKYSLVLMLDVLEHMPHPEMALRHALSLLDPQGALLVTVPAFRQLWTSHDELNGHFERYTKRSFGALAGCAGMAILNCRYFYHWLYPIKLGVRIAEALAKPPPRVPHVPPAWLNRALTVASTAEYRWLEKLDLPFGSSLLVVGRPAAGRAHRGAEGERQPGPWRVVARRTSMRACCSGVSAAPTAAWKDSQAAAAARLISAATSPPSAA